MSSVTTKRKQLKTKSKEDLDYFAMDEGKDIVTSFSLPVWNKRRLQHIVYKLKRKGVDVSVQEIALKSLDIIMTKLKRKDNKPLLNRAVRYNKTTSSYETIPVRLDAVKYNSLHSKKITMKVSLSYLLDLALRLYLRLLMNLFFQKKKTISTYISYYKKVKQFNFNTVFFQEKVQFFLKI